VSAERESARRLEDCKGEKRPRKIGIKGDHMNVGRLPGRMT
jgi:hypothetical protein